MKRAFLKKYIAAALLAVMLTAVCGYAAFGAGGSDDPLISLSYIDDVLMPKIRDMIDKAVEGSGSGGSQQPSAGGAAYESIQVFAGDVLLGRAGTELIVRIGAADAVCPGINGLVDATAGLDLEGGGRVQNNHVYIIPREDGRGIKMLEDGYVMIKGGYTIE